VSNLLYHGKNKLHYNEMTRSTRWIWLFKC